MNPNSLRKGTREPPGIRCRDRTGLAVPLELHLYGVLIWLNSSNLGREVDLRRGFLLEHLNRIMEQPLFLIGIEQPNIGPDDAVLFEGEANAELL